MRTLQELQPGCYYHVYNRGNNKQDIFLEDRNYTYFLGLYAKHIEPVADTFAYCLMPNHFHLLVKIKDAINQSSPASPPSKHFSNLFNAYAKAINKAYHRTGSMFEKPFDRNHVDSDRYFLAIVNYIHRNPQNHGFSADFRTYPHSSYQSLLSSKPTRLQRQAVLAWFGTAARFVEFHQRDAPTAPIAHLIEEREG